ncbi:MAG: FtsX-like permease family protein [Actinobacteria bacterium]|nr:FtsX-like permease family protein [Actinomycetota bacterium]
MGSLFILVPILVALAALALSSPVQRRLAVRQSIRRPRETMLVIAGSLLGTAIITGSFIVGDTLDSSVRVTAYTQLGPVDEMIQVPDPKQAGTIVKDIEALDDDRIDGVTSLLSLEAPVASSASGKRRAEPKAQLIELDFERGRSFGSDPALTGIRGKTPRDEQAVITTDVADLLRLSRGDELTAFVFGQEVDLEVDRIIERNGLAGFWTGPETTSANVFVAPGTLASAIGDELPEGANPPLTSVLVSNRGGVEDGARLSEGVSGVIEEELHGTPLRIEPIKQDRLDSAKASGEEFSELFVAIGTFAVVAGILLLINIFVMLAEERKKELGMMRAVGATRWGLVRGFVIEGAVYGFLAAVLGAALGVLVGWAIVKLAAPIFAGFGDFSLELTFDAEVESIVLGFVLGSVISFVSVFFTSLRISRINIIRAIRELPEPTERKTRLVTLIAATIFGLLCMLWFTLSLGQDDGWPGMLLGPALAVYALLPLLTRLITRRPAVILASTIGLAWGIFGNSILDGKIFEGGDIFAFVGQGVLLTFSAVVLLTQIQENLAHLLRAVAARGLTLRLGLAYPLAHRFRTGLTLGMYALVLFTMTFIAVLSNVFGGQVDATTRRASGGFDMYLVASQSNPPSTDEIEGFEGVDEVAPLNFAPVLYQPDGVGAPAAWTATGIDDSFIAAGTPLLNEKEEGKTAKEVWETVLEDPSTVIIDTFFLQQGGGGPPTNVVDVGAEVTLVDPLTGKRTDRRVIGIVDTDVTFAGSWMSKRSLDEALDGRAAQSRFHLTLDEGADVADVETRLQGEFFRNGVEASTFREQVELFAQANLQFLRLMQGYLALGLIVGIAGLGVLMVRAVRERRHEVGVLRSLGFMSSQVRRAFLLEAAFIAIEGILIGAALALVTAAQLIGNGDFGEGIAFTVPWMQVAVLIAVALIFSLFATVWPAAQAARIPPAVALRIAD